jgi:pimeloyl-ACP methyl ester carboxylesterase
LPPPVSRDTIHPADGSRQAAPLRRTTALIDHAESLLVDGRRLEVRRIGAPWNDTPTLVFLHEGLGSVALWKDFPDRLAHAVGWPALVYSRLGYGQSDPAPLPRPVSFLEDEAKLVLPRLLDAASVRDAVLVGHSDGASIALIHAATFPPFSGGVVRAVIAEAPHVLVEEVTLASIRRAGREYRDGDLRRRLERYHADVDVAFWGFHDVWLDPAFAGWTIESELGSIRVPLLVIQGEDDPYGTMRQVESIRGHAGGRVETVVLPAPCGHAPHSLRPDQVLDAMTAFLRSLSATPRTTS